ncbi:MAG TPA: hypothetical protein VJ844_03320 [Mucilaginibacter sp.]|nr:hypothetical protein [Mucilaginibacter sp.]
MRIKTLLCATIIVSTFSGCLKDSKQPVTHANDVKVSLSGKWSPVSGKITYYDATGNVAFNAIVTPDTLAFNDDSSVKKIGTAGSASAGTYDITTTGNTDYISVQSAGGNDQFAIVTLQSRKLVLSEKLTYPDGATLSVGDNTFIYYSSVQLNTYTKKDLPRN